MIHVRAYVSDKATIRRFAESLKTSVTMSVYNDAFGGSSTLTLDVTNASAARELAGHLVDIAGELEGEA